MCDCTRHTCSVRSALAFIIIVAILQCFAVTSPLWVNINEGTSQGYFGVWQTCVKQDSTVLCNRVFSDERFDKFTSPLWVNINEGTSQGYFGVWQTCVKQDSTVLCNRVFSDERFDKFWYYLFQAFASFGLLASLVTTTVAIQQHCGTRIEKCQTSLLALMSLITSSAIAASIILFILNVDSIQFASNQDNPNIKNLFVSAYASGVAFLFSLMAGIFFIVIACRVPMSDVEDDLVDDGPFEKRRSNWLAYGNFRSNKVHNNSEYAHYF